MFPWFRTLKDLELNARNRLPDGAFPPDRAVDRQRPLLLGGAKVPQIIAGSLGMSATSLATSPLKELGTWRGEQLPETFRPGHDFENFAGDRSLPSFVVVQGQGLDQLLRIFGSTFHGGHPRTHFGGE